MTARDAPSTAAAAVVERIEEMALGGASMDRLFDTCCAGLTAGGIPLVRAYVGFRMLHPLYEAASLLWTEGGIDNQLHPQGGGESEEWQRSPLHWLHQKQLPMMRRRLTGAEAKVDFPLLEDLKGTGHTDYVGLGVAFREDWTEGLLSSWTTKREQGFSESDLRDLRFVIRPLANAIKPRIERRISENIATAYLGQSAGRRVLSGAIRRGDGERISGALWYSDLRGSTAMAERMSPQGFLEALDAYFDRSASKILAHGGEVVSYIGDGVLGFFPDGADPRDACRRAFAAAREAAPSTAPSAEDTPPFSLALHHGSFIYGNIGTPERLQFTVIGAAINELARIQELTKTLAEPLLVSRGFADMTEGGWRDLGAHSVRGVSQPLALFAPKAPL